MTEMGKVGMIFQEERGRDSVLAIPNHATRLICPNQICATCAALHICLFTYLDLHAYKHRSRARARPPPFPRYFILYSRCELHANRTKRCMMTRSSGSHLAMYATRHAEERRLCVFFADQDLFWLLGVIPSNPNRSFFPYEHISPSFELATC